MEHRLWVHRGSTTTKKASDSTTHPDRLHTHTYSPKRLAHPRSPMPPLSTLTACATHALPLHPSALASVPYGIVLVRVRVRFDPPPFFLRDSRPHFLLGSGLLVLSACGAGVRYLEAYSAWCWIRISSVHATDMEHLLWVQNTRNQERGRWGGDLASICPFSQ